MFEANSNKLKTDKAFKRLIPPLSSNERQQLEDNIIRDGCREPLCVWNNIILDGHNRYEICTRLKIQFSIKLISLKTHEEAVAWMCANQLGRRNITDAARKYLIGKRYEMEKIIGVHNTKGVNQYSKKEVRSEMSTEPNSEEISTRTREKIGREYHISDSTVYKYGVYAQAMDLLSQVTPELVTKILSGEVKISHENIIELTKLSDQTVKQFSQSLSIDESEFVGSLHDRISQKQRTTNKPVPSLPSGSIKNMPSYDPDAEISALTLTIPSWISSISRTHSVTDLSNTTDGACLKLREELIGLRETIESMLTSIKEVT